MLTAILKTSVLGAKLLATAAVMVSSTPTHTVTLCHVANGGLTECVNNELRTNRLAEWLPGHTSVTIQGAQLDRPRAGAYPQRGRWNRNHDELSWFKGSLTCDGLTFVNYSNHARNVYARIAPISH